MIKHSSKVMNVHDKLMVKQKREMEQAIVPPGDVQRESIINKLREQGLAKQSRITEYTVVKRLNEVKQNHTSTSSLQNALLTQQTTGKLPLHTKQRKNKTMEEMLSGLQHVTPNARILEPELERTESITQQGAYFPTSWSSILQIHKQRWRALGGTPILGDQQTSYFRSEYQMPHCSVQRFDPTGSFLSSGYSYGEIMLHDFDEFSAICGGVRARYNHLTSRRVRDEFTGCKFNITEYPLEGNDAIRIREHSKESLFAFHSPIVRFTPRCRKPIHSLSWSGEDATLLNVSYRLNNCIDLFDLERCPESLDANGQPAFADPIQQFLPRTNECGINPSTPTDIHKPAEQDNILWSCARDGKLRMWDKRVRKPSSTYEKSICSAELTSLTTHRNLLWTTSNVGQIHAIDVRKSSESPSISVNNSKTEQSIYCSYSPTKLLQLQAQDDVALSGNTKHLCAMKIVDGQFVACLSGDGTVVMFDPFTKQSNSEFNNAKLMAYYQSSQLYTQKLLNANMFDVLYPTNRNSNSLIVIPSYNHTFSVLDLFGPTVERNVVNAGYPLTCLACHPNGLHISTGYGNENSNFGSMIFG